MIGVDLLLSVSYGISGSLLVDLRVSGAKL